MNYENHCNICNGNYSNEFVQGNICIGCRKRSENYKNVELTVLTYFQLYAQAYYDGWLDGEGWKIKQEATNAKDK